MPDWLPKNANGCFVHEQYAVRKPRYVDRLVDALDANPRAVLVFSDIISKDVGAESGPESIKVYVDLEGVTGRLERGVRVARKWLRRISSNHRIRLSKESVFNVARARLLEKVDDFRILAGASPEP